MSGRGHKEKNFINILFDFHWDILIEHVCESVGFIIPKQKLLMRKCKDHHKGFDLLMILSEAIDSEISYWIVKHMKSEGDQIPADVQIHVGQLLD